MKRRPYRGRGRTRRPAHGDGRGSRLTTRPRKRRWKQWTEAQPRAALHDWQSSGASAQAFAKQRGVSPHRLAYWRRRLAGDASIAFVPVLAPQRSEARIEIERAGGVLRLREGIDPTVLASIVTALARAGAPC